MSRSEIPQNIPIMTKEAFSKHIGVSIDVLNKHVRNNYLPTIRLRSGESQSKRVYINVAALREVCIADASEFIKKLGGDHANS